MMCKRDERIAQLWHAGMSSSVIAQQVGGITAPGVRAAARRLGLPHRPKGPSYAKQAEPRPPVTEVILPVVDDAIEAVTWRDPEVRRVVNQLAFRGIRLEAVVAMVQHYRSGLTVREISAATGVGWPVVHAAIFDLRRAGVDLPRARR